jgi:L-lactate dehydrogenase complex protein LldF
MTEKLKDFLAAAETTVSNVSHRETVASSLLRFEKSYKTGQQQFSDIELARERAAYTRWKAIEDLDKYLIEFESNFIKRGGKVLWAQSPGEAVGEILSIFRKTGVKSAVKSKSMTTEEIGLNEHLLSEGILLTETDLGEFIQQEAGERPYHIVTPAMHKSAEQIAELLSDKHRTALLADPAVIAQYVRKRLRPLLTSSKISITGANFLIADLGAVAITENEGNVQLSLACPKIHIVVAGIDKVLPNASDLDLFWPLLASHATGQVVTAYNTLLTGPRQPEETDGPDEMYVILLDNNRTEVLGKLPQRQAMTCIKCGACSGFCPVYKHIGGHAYNTTYNGPIGSILSYYLQGPEYSHLSYATPLCGKCTEVCPVKINLHKLLLRNRHDAIADKKPVQAEKWAFYFWKKAMLKRSVMNRSSKTKNFLLETFFKKFWGTKREFPKIAVKSFNELWREKHSSIYNR